MFSTFRTGYDLPSAEIGRRYGLIADQITMPGYFYPHVARVARRESTARSVLDIGCGNGYLLERVWSEWSNGGAEPIRLVGLEPSPQLARAAADRLGGRASILYAEGTDLPFPDGSFDLVLLTEVVEHVKRPVQLLHEVGRVLKGNGVLVATMPNMSAYEPFWRWARIAPNAILRRQMIPSEHPSKTIQPIDTAYQYSGIMRLLDHAGFACRLVYGREYFPFVIYGLPLVSDALYFMLDLWDRLAGTLFSPERAYRVILVATRKRA